jgi:hypothetical protein
LKYPLRLTRMNGIEKEVQREENEEKYITNKTKKKGIS